MGRLKNVYWFISLLLNLVELSLVQTLIISMLQYLYPTYRILREDTERIRNLEIPTIRIVNVLKGYGRVFPYRKDAHSLPPEAVCRILLCFTRGPCNRRASTPSGEASTPEKGQTCATQVKTGEASLS